MDVRRRKITQIGVQEGAGSDPSFLSGSERALSDEMASCRSSAMAARTVRDSGIVRVSGTLLDAALRLSRMSEINISTFVFILLKSEVL
jgi:hypothetical protein